MKGSSRIKKPGMSGKMPLFSQTIVMTGGPGEAVKDFMRALDDAGFPSPEGESVCWLLYEEMVAVFRRHTRTHSHTSKHLGALASQRIYSVGSVQSRLHSREKTCLSQVTMFVLL